MIGITLSHFRIVAKIGEGGMGVVYRAEDTKLRRQVALKVLPPDLVANEERRLRFLREARTAAAINHPNIATIYEADEADGVVFIAMELVEGKTLRDHIGAKPMAIKDSLRIATEMAEGLAKAHGAHVIHRDFKPDNVIVTADGHVKILDFGLAKLLEDPHEEAPAEMSKLATLSREMTREGKIFGTPAYMSPEQARGQQVDARSDLFSFGTTLYEMVTSKVPFEGKTATDTLSSIIRDEPPPPSQLNDTVPLELDRIIAECLEKDPQDRYLHTDQLVADLKKLKRTTDSGVQRIRTPSGPLAAAPAEPATAGHRHRKAVVITVVALLGVVVVAGGYLTWRVLGTRAMDRSSTPLHVTFSRVTSQPGLESWPSLSPDGKSVLYAGSVAGNSDIYLLRVGGSNAINLTKDSPSVDTHPAFSPDGERIAFRSDRNGGGIFIMGATGESAKRLSDSGYNPAWSPDGKEIVWATEAVIDPASRFTTSQLWTLNLGTGQKRQLFAGDAVQPQWSPHGQRVAFWAVDGGQRDIWTIPAQGGKPLSVTADPALDWNPIWSTDGDYLFFLSDRGGSMNLWRVPIDEASGKAMGQPEALTAPTSYVGGLSASRNGRRLAYVTRSGNTNIQRAPFDPVRGVLEDDPVWVTQGSRELYSPDVSPDGAWLALATETEQEDIFIVRPDGSALRQLTDDPYRDRIPKWSPHGKRIAFYSNRGGQYDIWTITPDGADLKPLMNTPGNERTEFTWSPDGLRLVFLDNVTQSWHTFDLIGSANEAGPKALPRIGETDDFITVSSWSQDGKWLAGHTSSPGGAANGVFVYSFETESYDRLTETGQYPVWLSDSRRLLFGDKGAIHLLDRVTRARREILSVGQASIVWTFSVSPDNRQLYFAVETAEGDIWVANLE